MSLLNQLHYAVSKGIVKEPFTTDDIKEWVKVSGIKKSMVQSTRILILKVLHQPQQ